MRAIGKTSLGRSELAHALEHKSVSGVLRQAIADLMMLGFVEYTIPEKPNSRLQKYRLANEKR